MNQDTSTVIGVDPSSKWQVRFWTFTIGQTLSLAGSQVTQFVLLWWITSTIGSTSALATAGIVGLLPQALLGPLGGVLADRFSRRMLMIVSDAISALCILVLVALFAANSVELWHLYTLMFIRSTMQAFQRPALDASIPNLVPANFISKANGLTQALLGITTIAAAPLGAVVLAVLPLQAALMIDVVTATLAVLTLLAFKIPQPAETQNKTSSVWSDFKEGVSYVTGNQGLWSLFLLLAVVVFLIMQSNTLTPLLVQQLFNGGPTEIALLQFMSGVGLILGGITQTLLPQRWPMTFMLVFFALGCAAVALTALSPLYWGAMVGWTLYGMGFAVGNAKMFAMLNTVVPNQIQGRTISLLTTMMGVVGPLGLLIAGPLGDRIGVNGVFIWGGALSTVICLLGLFIPAIHKLEYTTTSMMKSAKATNDNNS
jgi:MFS transporter, DHA3 family, macrolide efflux protein